MIANLKVGKTIKALANLTTPQTPQTPLQSRRLKQAQQRNTPTPTTKICRQKGHNLAPIKKLPWMGHTLRISHSGQ